MKRKYTVILDTSIFVNPDSRHLFGRNPDEALLNFLDKIKGKKHISCYMPPSVYEELSKFLEKPPTPQKSVLIRKKPPASYQTPIPSLFIYEFIEEMRKRINKGLRITEKYARRQIKKENEQEIIKSAREEYRVALREGMLDSKEDFDLLLLAKEKKAFLATSDQGLISWAHKLGIKCLSAEELSEVIA